jgi:hypothetical protein
MENTREERLSKDETGKKFSFTKQLRVNHERISKDVIEKQKMDI